VDVRPAEQAEGTVQDASWVKDTLAGRLEAFDRLIEKYQRRAMSVAYRLLGNVPDAADVCQDAFLKAFRSIGTLEDAARFGPWLMRIVSNLSLNFRRGRKSGATVSLDDVGDKIAELGGIAGAVRPAGSTSTADPAATELRAAIRKAIDALPEKQRVALVLFSIEGMPQKDVAAIMDCSVELVKWNVFQARKQLRQALAEYL
jgi:RNA polymerase sigma-70 factor (ECF subfamily)